MQSRAYQIEMFEESLKANRIICMSTGSGKTQIAKLRIEAELKKSPNKIVWFLAPNVALCQQQHTYLATQLPAHGFRIITSLDGVEHWSTQAVWDAALFNIEVVVSTPQPLLDALSHGFIHMSRLSLLVFDEAHHCTKKAPMNKIMQMFYHPARRDGLDVELPHILGLSASPVTSSKSKLEDVERNLDATCKTPTRQLEEYSQFVHEPEFLIVEYPMPLSGSPPQPLSQLRHIVDNLDINDDPYVHYLRRNPSLKNQDMLQQILINRATATCKQLQALARRASDVYCDLGELACKRFIAECTTRLHNSDFNANWLSSTMKGQEWKYLDTVLARIRSDRARLVDCRSVTEHISPKAAVLVDLLVREYTPDSRCVIFVKQRSAAWALSQLLNLHPKCQGKYLAAALVGLSKVDRNLQLVDLVKMRDPSEVLAKFKSGTVNILVATSVMEEGVDIPATNLVVRFDDSENFRSFIQSRGRARHPHSKFVTLFRVGDDESSYSSWKALEIEMRKKYADELRELARLEEDEEEEGVGKVFCVGSTQAKLTLDSAKQHLEHFCSKLPQVAYVDEPRPEYILVRVPDGVSARVILPPSVDVDFRQFSGSVYKSERLAKLDAAFEAYIGLYHAGLVNENLLPVVVPEMQDAASSQIESRESMCQARSRIDPWTEIARSCDPMNADVELVALRVEISGGKERVSPVLLVLPRLLKTRLNLSLLWTPSSTLTARITPSHEILPTSFETNVAQKVTCHLLKTVHGHKMRHQDLVSGYPYTILPADHITCLRDWLNDPLGMMSEEDKTSLENHLVRRKQYDIPYFLIKHIDSQIENESQDRPGNRATGSNNESENFASGSENSNTVRVMRLPKRVDFLHPVSSNMAHTAWESVPWSECTIENLPASYARAMLFIPSILHVVTLSLVAQSAAETLLAPIGFKDPVHVVNALSASAAQDSGNYQNLEFLGDSLLKYHTTVQLFVQFPKWHEGYLSKKKDSIVGNARLCRAALEVGLDRFIHTEPFAGAQWRVRTNADLRAAEEQTGRLLSTKVLADVVEALIGAAYMDGDDSQEKERQTIACIRLFVPDLPWESVQANIAHYQYPDLPNDIAPSHLETVEAMIGYQFESRILISQALTHPSAMGASSTYQRLEYLGDAVLDYIVATTMFPKQLNHFTMHLIRTAVVNAEFLAFLCLEKTADLTRFDVSTDPSRRSTVTPRNERKYLCQFMTSAGHEILRAEQSCIERHQELRERIHEAIQRGNSYPWSLLTRLRADKFLSDIIESILGAIFLDSRGSVDVCKSFLEKIGLLSYLQRLIHEPSIEIMHPKEKLGVVSVTAKIRYETSLRYEDDEQEIYTAKVIMDGEVFAICEDAYSKLEAETMAAELAVVKIAKGRHLLHEASIQ